MLEEFLECHQDREIPLKLSLPTFKRGISDLEKAQLVAKAKRKGWYYINPHFVFNGDRIAFTTLIENTSPPEKKQLDTNVHGDAHLQDNLPLEE
jgi:DNA-binding GntR family transcriptional regulator